MRQNVQPSLTGQQPANQVNRNLLDALLSSDEQSSQDTNQGGNNALITLIKKHKGPNEKEQAIPQETPMTSIVAGMGDLALSTLEVAIYVVPGGDPMTCRMSQQVSTRNEHILAKTNRMAANRNLEQGM